MRTLYKFFGLLLLIAVASAAHAQTAYFNGQVQLPSGQAVPSALITVCAFGATGIPCSPAVATATTDANGNYSLALAPGNYVVCATGAVAGRCANQTIGSSTGGGACGTLAATQVLFGTAMTTCATSARFTWNNAAQSLEVHSNVINGGIFSTMTLNGTVSDAEVQGTFYGAVILNSYTDAESTNGNDITPYYSYGQGSGTSNLGTTQTDFDGYVAEVGPAPSDSGGSAGTYYNIVGYKAYPGIGTGSTVSSANNIVGFEAVPNCGSTCPASGLIGFWMPSLPTTSAPVYGLKIEDLGNSNNAITTGTGLVSLGGNVTVPHGGISLGGAAGTFGTGGGIAPAEGTAATAASGYDILYADSTAHALELSNNNGTFYPVVSTGATQTLTNKTLTSPTLTTPALGAATATSLLATGIVDGEAPVTVTTGATATLGGTYNHGYTFNQEATAATAITYTLPTAAAGKQYCVANSYGGAADTGTIELATSASGQYIIFTDGTLSASGGYVISGGAARDGACVVGVDATHWILYVYSGTWAKH